MYKAKPIIVYRNNEFYKQYRAQFEAIEDLGVHRDKLRKMLKKGENWNGYTAEYLIQDDKYRKPHTRNFGNKAKSVCQYDLEGNYVGEFSSIREAADAVNVSRNCISRALREKKTISGGYLWRQVKVDKIFINLDPKPPRLITNPIRGTKVGAFDPETDEKIDEFISLTQASKWAGISRSAISLVVTGRQKTAGGKVWRYLNDNGDTVKKKKSKKK